MVKAVVGANWGDEGKGKITDTLANEADIVIRFQGGANAGHTIVNEYGKFALHLLPSGVFHQNITNVIGNGVAFDIDKFLKELGDIESKGVPAPNIIVSDRVQVLMPYHIQFDTLEEARLAGKSFGSTKSGIAPFYSDKYAKIGWQINEFYQDDDALMEKYLEGEELTVEDKGRSFSKSLPYRSYRQKGTSRVDKGEKRQNKAVSRRCAKVLRGCIKRGKDSSLRGAARDDEGS